MVQPTTKKPSARAEEIRKTRAAETAKANMASRATATAKNKTAKAVATKYGAKALGALGVGYIARESINEFRSARTGADKAMAAANLMQTAHPIGWGTSIALDVVKDTPQYQKAQTKALDWVDSVNMGKKLRDAAAESRAVKGAAAARKRREAATKSTKGKK